VLKIRSADGNEIKINNNNIYEHTLSVGEGENIKTIKVNNFNHEFVDSDFGLSSNITSRSNLLSESIGTGQQLLLTTKKLDAVVDEAKNRWLLNLASDSRLLEKSKELFDTIKFEINDLNQSTLATTSNNIVTIDADAAGYGWFADSSPNDDLEFTLRSSISSSQADLTSPAYGHFDLLTVVMHELGHVLGFGVTDQSGTLSSHSYSGSSLMKPSLAPSMRINFLDLDSERLFTEASSGSLEATLSDESILLNGLQSFAHWAGSMSLGDTVGISLPFVKEGLDSLWSSSGIADAIQSKLSNQIASLFTNSLEVTARDILAIDSDSLKITASPSGRANDFVASVRITNYSNDFILSSDTLSLFGDIGFDVSKYLGVNVSQSEPLQLDASLDLVFGFGIDSSTGKFFVENPTLKGGVELHHDNPLDLSLAIGPVGVGINDAKIHFNAGISLPTNGRFNPQDLTAQLSFGLPKFDPTSSFELDLPLEFQTSLAGLNTKIGRLHGSVNVLNGANSSVGNLTAKQFFTLLPQNIEFEGDGFGSLMDLSKISLDSALEGIKQVLSSAIDPQGPAFQPLPFVNKSAVQLLGSGSVDVVQNIVDAISTVQKAAANIDQTEIDLNQEINRSLGLHITVLSDESVDAAHDALSVLPGSPSSKSTDDQIAVAIAQSTQSAVFSSLQIDRDLRVAFDNLGSKGLSPTSTDQQTRGMMVKTMIQTNK
jgi:hypothetical protein